MKSFLPLIAGLVLFPLAAFAAERPPAQIAIDSGKILRGTFVEEKTIAGADGTLRSSGVFTLAPANGLIWNMQQPIPTTTIITAGGAVQDFGGLTVKLHAKNIRHLYDMVGGALVGDWSGLEQDFIVTRGGTASHWQMTLTPRDGGTAKTPYSVITVSGASFVEKIVMIKNDGSSDIFTFANEALSPIPLAPQEAALFSKASP